MPRAVRIAGFPLPYTAEAALPFLEEGEEVKFGEAGVGIAFGDASGSDAEAEPGPAATSPTTSRCGTLVLTTRRLLFVFSEASDAGPRSSSSMGPNADGVVDVESANRASCASCASLEVQYPEIALHAELTGDRNDGAHILLSLDEPFDFREFLGPLNSGNSVNSAGNGHSGVQAENAENGRAEDTRDIRLTLRHHDSSGSGEPTGRPSGSAPGAASAPFEGNSDVEPVWIARNAEDAVAGEEPPLEVAATSVPGRVRRLFNTLTEMALLHPGEQAEVAAPIFIDNPNDNPFADTDEGSSVSSSPSVASTPRQP